MVSRTGILLILAACVLAGLAIAGCTQQSPAPAPTTAVPATPAATAAPTPAPTTAATGTAGLPNPASVNCVNNGGNLTIMDSPAGQYGMCGFPNGTSCEEWALFRGEGCKPGVAPAATTAPAAPAANASMANPASVNCVNNGGNLTIRDSPTGQIGICSFPNGTSCEEWALFRGEPCNATAASATATAAPAANATATP